MTTLITQFDLKNGGATPTGAVNRPINLKLSEMVSVQDFGATGDGVTDDTVAIQNAINYCQDNIKALYFPSNTVSQYYKTTAPLVVSKPLTMTGESSRNVTIIAVGLTAGQFLLDIDGTTFGTYEQGNFSGFTLFASAGNCMRIKNVSSSKFSDITLRDSVNGIIYTGTRCYSNTFERIIVTGGITGESFIMQDHTGGGQHGFFNCSFGGNTGFSISSSTVTDSVNFYNTNFEQCIVNSFYTGGSVSGLGFYGCRTEGCNGIDFQINPTAGNSVTGFVVEGCAFSASDAGGSPRILLGGVSGEIRGFNVNANSVSHGTNNFSSYLVQLNGDGESGTIANNFLDGTLANCAPVNALRPAVAVYNNEANNGKFSPSFTLETGTWTPTDTSGAGLTFTNLYCNYTKISNVVTVSGQITFPSTSSSADITIGGLPFTIASNTIATGAITSTNGASLTTWISAASSPYIRIRNASGTLVPNSSLSTGTFSFTLTYFA
jgi:hypothetical protein